MESFLLKVVIDVLKKNPNSDNTTFILPNQRAGVYIQKYLKSQIKTTSFFPEIMTFDNFSEQLAGIIKTPATELLFDFYTIYKLETPTDEVENFEQFTNWATTVLNDFNDIDGYLVEPKNIFKTLKDINKLHNWNPNTKLTKNYLTFFRNLEKYYKAFYKYLHSNQKGYQGLILKEAVATLQHYIANTDKYFVFIGFNHLKHSEFQIVEELLAANRACVYWDINETLQRQNSIINTFIKSYKISWEKYKNNIFESKTPLDFDADKIEIIGVPKSVGMLKHVGEILNNQENFDEVALVMSDQNVLPITLNSIPKKIDVVNITMGFPLKTFPFSDLIKNIFELHTKNKNTLNNKAYYHKSVIQILQHPILQTHVKGIEKFVEQLIAQNKVYITLQDIENQIGFNKHSKEVITSIFKAIEPNEIHLILSKINRLVNYLKDKVSAFEKEILYQHYQLNQQLVLLTEKHQHITSIKSLYQIYRQLLHNENVSFIGQPLHGLQIMGFLETQALDFNHLIVTSLNEGVLPKGKRVNSFIPFDVRKHYGLLTYQEEDAIQAYHFYRLLQGPNKISLLYNAQTDTFGGGEKSRFLTQLLWNYPNIQHKIINPKVPSDSLLVESVEKTPEVLAKLKELAIKGFSPSALATYLYNPIEFYHQKILGIKEFNKIEETVADNTMGTVIHETLEKLYTPYIDKVLDDDSLKIILSKAQEQVEVEFKNVYKNGQYNQGKNKLIYEVIVNFVTRFIKNEIKVVKSGQVIKILALELPLSYKIQFPKFGFPIKFGGIVDRIDEVNGVLRIVDYKSGKVEKTQLHLDDFSKIMSDYKYSKGLQIMLYAYLFKQDKSYNFSKEFQAGIISFKNLKSGFIPVNFGTSRKPDYQITDSYLEGFLNVLEELLLEIFDPTIPFIEGE